MIASSGTHPVEIALNRIEAARAAIPQRVGVVAIGRNEGERLARCLESVMREGPEVVYVDSGSTDGSAERARALGATVVELRGGPYTAARGRQAGLEALMAARPDLEIVQFIDGDCVLDPAWLPLALAYMEGQPRLAAVGGRRREERDTFYSRLIDIDWDYTPGPALYVGGDALWRIGAIREAGGWPVDLIAGEEPDLCFRLLDRGWGVERLPAEMTRHDIDMRSFREYWRRSVRTGHGYAEVSRRRGGGAGRLWMRRKRSMIAYGGLLPLTLVFSAWAFWPVAVVVVAIYGRLVWSLARSCRGRGVSRGLAVRYALLNTVCKVAGFLGVMRYYLGRWSGRRSGLIEYKDRARGAAEEIGGTHAAAGG